MTVTSPRFSCRTPTPSVTAITPEAHPSFRNTNENNDEESSINVNGKREATNCEFPPRKSQTISRSLSDPRISNLNDSRSSEGDVSLDSREGLTATSNTEFRLRRRVGMASLGMGLESFKSLKMLMRISKDIVHIIKLLWQAGGMHGDLNFRNILIDEREGQVRGILLDFGYAAPVNENKTSSGGPKFPYSRLTGSLPFVAANDLRDKPKFSHTYFHDLESLFYVLCWISTLYAGPCGAKRPFSKSKLSYRKTTVAGWNGEASNKLRIYESKSTSTSYPFRILKELSPYFRHIDDCLESLRALLFCPGIGNAKDKAKKEQLKSSLETALNDHDYSTYADFVKRFEKIPIEMRPPEIVLDSFTLAFSEMESKLPEDETALMEAVEESDDESEEDSEEGYVFKFEEDYKIIHREPHGFYYIDNVDNSGYDGRGPREIIPRRLHYRAYGWS